MIEIGPRFTLQPIKMFGGSIGGEALWQNTKYITPSRVRSKVFCDYLKKRDEKQSRKHDKK
jgi:ribosome biogenesis protein BRX1